MNKGQPAIQHQATTSASSMPAVAPTITPSSSSNVSAKEKYRALKKKFKFLVYENECYQEELRNLQRRLLKLSRDKNFLLDRLSQHEKVSDSSDDSDLSSSRHSEEIVVKPKKKKTYPSKKAQSKQSETQPSTPGEQTSTVAGAVRGRPRKGTTSNGSGQVQNGAESSATPSYTDLEPIASSHLTHQYMNMPTQPTVSVYETLVPATTIE